MFGALSVPSDWEWVRIDKTKEELYKIRVM
jgi:hypothetical protein